MRVFTGFLHGIGVSLLVMAGVFALNIVLFTEGNRADVFHTLKAALKENALNEKADFGPLQLLPRAKSFALYRHDCLLWRMMLKGSGSEAGDALRNNLVVAAEGHDPRVPDNSDCQVLLKGLTQPKSAHTSFYDRYILAQK